MKKTTFLIVGYGNIGKRHAEIILNRDDCQLLGVVDPVEKPVNHIAWYASIDECIQSNNRADVVCICTPNGLHAGHAIRFLEAGSHVVIEKPMALSRLHCEQVVQAARQSNRHVFVVKQNRYSPPARWLKELVDSGKLGGIYLLQINCYWNRDGRYYRPGGWRGTLGMDGGVLFTQFSHFVDLLYWVFGDIDHITGRKYNFSHQQSTEFADTGTLQFELPGGGLGILNFSTSVWDKNLESSLTLIGQNGSLKIGGQYMERVEYCHIRDYSLPELEQSAAPNQYKGYSGSASNHHLMIQNVLDTLQGNGVKTASAEDGMMVVDMIGRMYRACQ